MLGLLRPRVPVSYGVMSKGGVMSLMLPTWHPKTKKELPRGENKPQINGMDCETFYFTG